MPRGTTESVASFLEPSTVLGWGPLWVPLVKLDICAIGEIEKLDIFSMIVLGEP